MSQITLLAIQEFVQDFIPDLPVNKITRKANLVIQKIHRLVPKIDRGTLTTRAEITTGTVSVTQDSATATFSSSVLVSGVPMLVQIDGDQSWFTVTYISGTSGTLSSTWAQTTAGTATYKIVFPVLQFDSTVLQPLNIWRTGFQRLQYIGSEYQAGVNAVTTTGVPEFWSPFVPKLASGADTVQVMIYPAPDQRYVLEYDCIKRPTLFTVGGASSQTSDLPEWFNEALLAGVLYFCWDQEDKQDRSGYWRGEYERLLLEALGTANIPNRTRLLECGEDDEGRTWNYEQRPVI
jgi:hypothetical protein